jgi:ferredoxin-NAD(P)+ reductase (naphthalene dioxygenase ferredoxin-specific)
MGHKVRIANIGRVIEVADEETILEAAIANGLNYPFGCHSGTCGACKSTLISGAVRMLDYSKFALTDPERAEGQILVCSAVPVADCEIRYVEESDAPLHPMRKLDCRVVGLESATHDIKILTLEVSGGSPLEFSAGQFARLSFGDLPGRDFSMANRPDEPLLEFHVRLVPDGAISGFVHRGLRIGDLVTLRGPYGTCFLRPGHPGPILALAGGSGLAPIKSIVETALHGGFRHDIRLYFGVRAERDIYFEERFEAIARNSPNFSFIPVLSAPSGPTPRRTGFLADAVREDFRDLDGWKAYLAGPPVMVDTCVDTLTRLDIRRDDIHADAFYTEAERPAGAS